MFIKFFNDIKSELGKISWIDKSENIKSTAGVVVVTIILGVISVSYTHLTLPTMCVV